VAKVNRMIVLKRVKMMCKKGVLVVYKEDYPWDVRVEKIVLALCGFGKNVFVLSNNIGNRETKSNGEGCRIFRIPAMAWMPRRVSGFFKLPIWFNPIWVFTLWRILKKEEIHTVIVRDLPLIRTILLFKKRYNLTVIYDMAEVYPEMYKSMQFYSKPTIFNRFLKNPTVARTYEKSVLKKIDFTFTMIDESRDRLLRMGISPEKVGIVSNTASVSKLSDEITHTGRDLRIVYVGNLTKLRGLDLLLEAISRYLIAEAPKKEIRVDIIGTGSSKEGLIDLCNKLKLNEVVTIHGWLSQDEVDRKLAEANLGVVTYRVCGHWNHTIPNKIFDYMASGLPVLSTPVVPIKRIITETECGLVTDDESPESICQALKKLADASFRQKLSNNGRLAILEKYNWEHDKSVMKCSLSKLGVV